MDDADKKAAELLTCRCQRWYKQEDVWLHGQDCPANYRPAVAAALRVARQNGYDAAHSETVGIVAEKDAEIAKLREERDTYQRIADRNHRANLMPCSHCGHTPRVIKPMDTIARLKHVPYKADRCACVFEGDDNPVSWCAYHADLRARGTRLDGLKKALEMADIYLTAHGLANAIRAKIAAEEKR